MKKTMSFLLFAFCFLNAQEGKNLPYGPVVLPLVLDPALFDFAQPQPGEEWWVDVVFHSQPHGEVLFREPSEKLWFLQGHPVLLLGGTGQQLPVSVLTRGTVWVQLAWEGRLLNEEPLLLWPRRDLLRMGAGGDDLRAALQKRMPAVDGAYIAQIANFLAGNLATLDITGSSYSVVGFGPVIGSGGEWLGADLDQNLWHGIQADTGTTQPNSPMDMLTVNGTGSVSTSLAGDTLTITGSGLTSEVDGDTTNELQNLFSSVAGDVGTTVADSITDELFVVGSGSVSTSVSGDTLLITGTGLQSEQDGDPTNELQNLFSTINADSGSASAATQADSLAVVGSGSVSTSLSGNTLTINGSGGAGPDSLDFSEISDSLILDDTTSIDMDTQTADLNLDDATFFVDSSANRIGVGTSNPEEKLHVEGGSIRQTPVGPVLVSSVVDDASLELSGAHDVYVQGRYAYVTGGADSGIQIIDVFDPHNPVPLGSVSNHAGTRLFGPTGIYVAGSFAYVTAISDRALQIIDVSNPSNPVGRGFLVDDGTISLDGINKVVVQGKYAYAASSNDDALSIIDVSDPDNPFEVGALIDDATTELFGAIDVVVRGNYAYVAGAFDHGVEIVDISDPTQPLHVGAINDDATTALRQPIGIAVSGKYAFVTSSIESSVAILDISDPSNPTHVARINGPGAALNFAGPLWVVGEYLYVAGEVSDGISVFNIADPVNPVLLGNYIDASGSVLNRPRGIHVSGNYAYVAASVSNSMAILDISGLQSPAAQIGSLMAGNLDVSENAQVGNQLMVFGGVSTGPGGISSEGPLAVSGSGSFSDNLAIGAIPGEAGGGMGGVLTLGDADQTPTTSLPEGGAFFATGGELFAYDSAGNATQISPHDKATGDWVFYSRNTKTGRVVRINMEQMIRTLEALTGKTFIQEWYEP